MPPIGRLEERDGVDGVVNLYKPAGISSAKYAYRLRPIIGIRKVGHAGTLDPFAEGVLLVCCGRATKLVERLMALPKVYRTTLQLGVTSASHDPEQPIETVSGAVPPDDDRVCAAAAAFLGQIEQVPPVFSAVKVNGRRAYKLAARGQDVQIAAKIVQVYGIDVVRYAWPELELVVRCGRGTYIRALARDLGEALGTGALCRTLTRQAVGPFTCDRGVQIGVDCDEAIRAAVMPIEDVLAALADAGSGDVAL